MKLFLSILKWLGVTILALFMVFAVILLINTDVSNPADTQTFIENKLEKMGIVGASVAVIKDGEVTETYQYGYQDLENRIPVNHETVFQIASTSKGVTGTAIMQLYERGYFDLDDDINNYLPYAVRHPQYPEIPITFRMLLSHTGGLENNWDLYDSLYTIESGGGDSPISLDEFTRGFFIPGGKYYDATLNFAESAPGETYTYSNPGYALLGYLVEEITKQSFPSYCKENIFEPLDMQNTTWMLANTDSTKLARLYVGEDENLVNYAFPTYPDGGLITTPTDYSHLMIALMNGGEYEGNHILQPQTIDEMLTPCAKENQQALTWDYGVMEELYLGNMDNGEITGHTGGDFGMFSVALFNPKKNTGVVIFMNEAFPIDLKALNIYQLLRGMILRANLL